MSQDKRFGPLLIALGVIIVLAVLLSAGVSDKEFEDNDFFYQVGYFTGQSILALLGVIMIWVGIRKTRRTKKGQDNEEQDDG